jgi:hypothetical protein
MVLFLYRNYIVKHVQSGSYSMYRHVGLPAECICVDLGTNSGYSSDTDGRDLKLATHPHLKVSHNCYCLKAKVTCN